MTTIQKRHAAPQIPPPRRPTAGQAPGVEYHAGLPVLRSVHSTILQQELNTHVPDLSPYPVKTAGAFRAHVTTGVTMTTRMEAAFAGLSSSMGLHLDEKA